MGRNTYNGGSTVIRPGQGWFSGEKPKRDKPSGGDGLLSLGGKYRYVGPGSTRAAKRVATSKVSSEKGTKRRKYGLVDYLKGVIRAEQLNLEPPVSTNRPLRALIQKNGGPFAWARTQDQYTSLKEDLLSKLGNKASVKEPPPRVRPEQPQPVADARSIRSRIVDLLPHLVAPELAEVLRVVEKFAATEGKL